MHSGSFLLTVAKASSKVELLKQTNQVWWAVLEIYNPLRQRSQPRVPRQHLLPLSLTTVLPGSNWDGDNPLLK